MEGLGELHAEGVFTFVNRMHEGKKIILPLEPL